MTTNKPVDGSIRIICPRCQTSFVPVRGKLPMHTRPVEGFQRNGIYKETQAVVCK